MFTRNLFSSVYTNNAYYARRLLHKSATVIYRIAGKFRGVKNLFNSRKGGFRE